MPKRRDILRNAAVASGFVALAGCANESDGGDGGDGGGGDGGDTGAGDGTTTDGGGLPSSIKVGVISPQTGAISVAGTAIRQAAELRAGIVNDQGGIDGETEIELVFGDSACDPSQGTQELQNMVSQEDIDFLIGDYCSPVTLSMMPITNQNEIVQITPSEAAAVTGAEHERNVFREGPQSRQQAPKMAKYAAEEDGNTSMAILAANNDWGTSQAEALQDAASEYGVTIEDTMLFDMGASDFSTELARVGNMDVDGLAAIGYEAHNINIARGYDELGLSQTVYGSTLWGFVSVREEVGNITTDMTLRYPNIIDPRREVTAQFREEYRNEYGEEAWANASWGYGGIQIIEQAVAGTGSAGYEDTIEWLYDNEVDIAQGSFGFAECGQATIQAQIATNVSGENGVIAEPLTDFEYAADAVPELCQ